MNWDNVRVFLAVAKSGSVSQAGRSLGINHSTVLRRIQNMEEELNARLFHREPRGYSLTAIGERILDAAMMMDQDATTLLRQVISTDDTISGPLTIAMPPGTCLDLMSVIQSFKNQYPDINLTLDSQTNLHNLDKMEADVAIRLTMEPPERYIAHHLFDMDFQLYAHFDYLNERKAIQALSDVEWICYDIPVSNITMGDWLNEQHGNAKVSVSINTLALAKQAILGKLGVGFLPTHIATKYADLSEVPTFNLDFQLPVYLLVHRDLYYQPRIKRFVDHVRKYVKEDFLN